MLDGMTMTVTWLIIAIGLAIFEAATLGIVTIWFTIGAFTAMLASMTGASSLIQIIIFIIVSGVLLYFTRPIVKRYLIKKTQNTNADRLVGEKAVIIEKIDAMQGKGQVKVLGQIWSARSIDKNDIEKGEIVEVLEISGVRLIVKKT